MVETLLPNAGGTGLIPDQGAGIPHASQNRSNIVTNSIKTLKIVHIKKKILKNTTKEVLLLLAVKFRN